MNKFKNYIENINEYTSFKIEFFISKGMIPIGTKMMDRLGYSYEDENLYHLTNFNDLENLKKIQKTNKSISCFTKGGKELAVLPSQPNVLVELSGNVLIESDFDMWTFLDKQGRRWIDINSGKLQSLTKNTKSLIFRLEGIRNKVIKSVTNILTDDDLEYSKTIENKLNELNKKDKAIIVKKYMDEVEKFLDGGGYKLLNTHFKENKSFDYNEVVVNKIDITGVYSIDVSGLKITKDDIENIKLKYLGNKTFREIINLGK